MIGYIQSQNNVHITHGTGTRQTHHEYNVVDQLETSMIASLLDNMLEWIIGRTGINVIHVNGIFFTT